MVIKSRTQHQYFGIGLAIVSSTIASSKQETFEVNNFPKAKINLTVFFIIIFTGMVGAADQLIKKEYHMMEEDTHSSARILEFYKPNVLGIGELRHYDTDLTDGDTSYVVVGTYLIAKDGQVAELKPSSFIPRLY